jgi:hypothetical protein
VQTPAVDDQGPRTGKGARVPDTRVEKFGLDPKQPVTDDELETLMDVHRPQSDDELLRGRGTDRRPRRSAPIFSAAESIRTARG